MQQAISLFGHLVPSIVIDIFQIFFIKSSALYKVNKNYVMFCSVLVFFMHLF